jgi:hypothetical protein
VLCHAETGRRGMSHLHLEYDPKRNIASYQEVGRIHGRHGHEHDSQTAGGGNEADG